ncbi:MAG TPA: beta-ribofuranosylaminobenzene 5'-phosphate synthase [Planctomycetaceae bacterium]|nr:beta-ribofuranosylaminobenzene 5'-phosphate synthase [Planctomycetaceae bacterium]
MAEASLAVYVRTGSRLHFGLFDTHSPFGGVGVMIDQPQTMLRITPAPNFDAGTVDSQRLIEIARQFTQSYFAGQFNEDLPPCKIQVLSAADPHFGLGSGTQLALATAAGLANFFDVQASRSDLIHHIAQRGKRSAVGSIGFFTGGLIIEDGSAEDYDCGSWWRHADFPAQWRFLLIRPPSNTLSISGEVERHAFASLPAAGQTKRSELIQLGNKIFDSTLANDFKRFAQAVTRFNRLSGALFATHQGGCYNGPAVTELIEHVASLGATAYGQSSWGPTVFVVTQSQHEAEHFAAQLNPKYSVAITQTKPTGVSIDKTIDNRFP